MWKSGSRAGLVQAGLGIALALAVAGCEGGGREAGGGTVGAEVGMGASP